MRDPETQATIAKRKEELRKWAEKNLSKRRNFRHRRKRYHVIQELRSTAKKVCVNPKCCRQRC